VSAFVAFAAHEFELAVPQQPDGLPLKEHLMAVWAQTGREPAMLANAPAMPKGCARLWADFLELSHVRGSTQAGPMPITWADIDAWQRVRGVRLEAWEVDAIRKTDLAFLKTFAVKRRD
jgi:hypothetical protein